MLLNSFFFVFSLLQIIKTSNVYDLQKITTCVWLSGAAYCGKENYNKMILGGPASGFIYKDTLYDENTDLQGYTGIIKSSKSIYVVLRGSSSIMNWFADLEIKLVPYTTFTDCSCNVHYGFYKSALGVKNETISSIEKLKKIYPSYSIIVTGHSYGAAVGQLLAMELRKKDIDVELYNYGQPRVGDEKYADFVNTQISEYWRVTHNKDIVPHIPPHFNYVHSCREVFENEAGYLNICSEIECEDPNCANQFSLSETNIEDHSFYLQHELSCEESTL